MVKAQRIFKVSWIYFPEEVVNLEKYLAKTTNETDRYDQTLKYCVLSINDVVYTV